jgi:hypothetical protein
LIKHHHGLNGKQHIAINQKIERQINAQMNFNNSWDSKNIPSTEDGGMLSDIFLLYTRVLLQAVEFPAVPYPLNPTTKKKKKKATIKISE